MAPDVQFADHRRLGMGAAQGSSSLVRAADVVFETIDDGGWRVADVLALDAVAFLTCDTFTGVDRATGGRFELEQLSLREFDEHGQYARLEWFDHNDVEHALSRFDELTTPRAPDARRRVRSNAATILAIEMVDVWAERAPDRLERLLAEGAVIVNHPTGREYDRAGAVAFLRSLITAGDWSMAMEPLATLGERLGLFLYTWVVDEMGEEHLSDWGASSGGGYTVLEADADGLERRWETFGDHLADAVVRIYELYAEQLPAGPERDQADAVATILRDGTPQADVDRWVAGLAPDFEMIDRRRLGFGRSRGRGVHIRGIRLLVDLAESVTIVTHEVLALAPTAQVTRASLTGVDRATGGTFDDHCVQLMQHAADGRIARVEWYDVDDIEPALARFDVLTAPDVLVLRRVMPNAATANEDARREAFARRDLTAIEQLAAADIVFVNHATGRQYGLAGALAFSRSMFAATDSRFSNELLATLGDRLALYRVEWAITGMAESHLADWGPSASSGFRLLEVDGEGRSSRSEIFSPDHLGDAIGRCYARYAEQQPDGPAWTRAILVAHSMTALLATDVDPERYASALAADADVHDHRRLGFGSGGGREAIIDGFRVLLTVTETIELRVDDVLALRPDGLLIRLAAHGLGHTAGGEYLHEHLDLLMTNGEGLVAQLEMLGPR